MCIKRPLWGPSSCKEFLCNCCLQVPPVLHPASCMHPASYIKYPAYYILYPVSCILSPAACPKLF